MKLKIILILFAGMFLMVSCKKDVITSDEVAQNISAGDKTEGDESTGDETTGNDSTGIDPTGVELPDGNIAQDGLHNDWNTYLDGYNIQNIADAGDYLWLSTIKEVYRLEKQTGSVTHFGFENIEMPSDYSIKTIKCDQNGLPWIGAGFTGTLKLTSEGKWNLLPQVSTDLFEKGTHEILFADNGVVWTSTINILARYQGNTVETFATNGTIVSLGEDIEGNIWIGTGNYFHAHYEGLVRYDGKNWIIYNSSPTGSVPMFFNPIAGDKDGTLWMGGYEGIDNMYTNLVEFNGTDWYIYRPNFCQSPFYINEIAIDEAGTKWLATNKGLIAFRDGSWNRCDDLNSRLQSRNIFAVVIDGDGRKWIGTDQGLAVFD